MFIDIDPIPFLTTYAYRNSPNLGEGGGLNERPKLMTSFHIDAELSGV